MIYLPEILPLPGVTISIFFRGVGKVIGYVLMLSGGYSPIWMIIIIAVVFLKEGILLKIAY